MTKESLAGIEQLLKQLTAGMYLRQVVSLSVLFLVGFLLLYLLSREKRSCYIYLLAFPTGLASWCIVSFFLLTLGIPMNIYSVSGVMIVFLLGVFVLDRKNKTDTKKKKMQLQPVWLVIVLFFLLVIDFVWMPLSISNDSYYYYHYYPNLIVQAQGYTPGMEVFLADVGPLAAIIGTIPFQFGYDSSFAIQKLMNLNFALIFVYSLYEYASIHISKKSALFLTAAASAVLFTAAPYIVTTDWVLANNYMMQYTFLLFYMGMRIERRKRSTRELIPFIIWMAMLSMLRMEGGILAIVLLLCLSCLSFTNREILLIGSAPIIIMQLLYYGRYFIGLKADPLYSFLDIKKAGIAIAIQLAAVCYFCLIRYKRMKKIEKYIPYLIMAALVAGNLLLLILRPSHYLGNIKAFIQNIMYQQGWGYTVMLLLVFYLLLPWQTRREKFGYIDLTPLSYILFTIAVCFARGGVLRQGIGDSGNRVMMQVIPFLVFALAGKVIMLIKVWEKGKENANEVDNQCR